MAAELHGRTAIVTGAGGGLGRAIALGCARAGARVAALDRDEDALQATATLLAAQGAAESLVQRCDVTSEPDVLHAMAAVRERLGPVDLLVNNAGITHRSAFSNTRTEVLRRVIEVNYLGAVYCTHAALPELLQRQGTIVAISSVAGFAPLIARTGYAASKHALHGFFDSLRSEVEPAGVHVLLVCPSFITTGIERHALGGDGNPARHPQVTVGGRSDPDAVADRILRAAVAGKRLLLPDRTSRMAWWASRLAPRWYERQMVRRLGSEMQG